MLKKKGHSSCLFIKARNCCVWLSLAYCQNFVELTPNLACVLQTTRGFVLFVQFGHVTYSIQINFFS